MTEDQPEYKAIENYALAAGGEKGIIGLSAIKLNFYWQNQLLDVSLCQNYGRNHTKRTGDSGKRENVRNPDL